MTTPSWQQVAAALGNPRLREAYARCVLDIPSSATKKELKKLVSAGLLHYSESSVGPASPPGPGSDPGVAEAGQDRKPDQGKNSDDGVEVNEDLFATLLASQQSSKPSGPDRFFHHGRITSLPRKDDDRHELLAHLSVRLFPAEDVLDEDQINLLVRTVARDVPSLRRALVDYGYLKRDADGSKYWRAA
ncbi:DUF2087 domain-containing protein [Arthrobacter pigmenti]